LTKVASGATPAVVGVGRVDAGGDLTGAVDGGDVLSEVPGAGAVEVLGQIRVRGVDAGVDDADVDPAAGGLLVRLVDTDQVHVPLAIRQRLGAPLGLLVAVSRLRAGHLVGTGRTLGGVTVRQSRLRRSDRVVADHRGHVGGAIGLRHEAALGGGHLGDLGVLVEVDDLTAGRLDRLLRLRGAAGVDDHVLLGRRRAGWLGVGR
jgi:hypothetical protein